jgi:hypothetical protein
MLARFSGRASAYATDFLDFKILSTVLANQLTALRAQAMGWQSGDAPGFPRRGFLSADDSVAVADDALDLQEIVQREIGIFAPVAGLLVAAERGGEVDIRVVHVHAARAHLGRHRAGLE